MTYIAGNTSCEKEVWTQSMAFCMPLMLSEIEPIWGCSFKLFHYQWIHLYIFSSSQINDFSSGHKGHSIEQRLITKQAVDTLVIYFAWRNFDLKLKTCYKMEELAETELISSIWNRYICIYFLFCRFTVNGNTNAIKFIALWPTILTLCKARNFPNAPTLLKYMS